MTDHENNRTVLNALPVGYRFNEFEIKEVIGGGGFGIVYRAWDHQLERTIAIKEFMPSSLAVRNEDMTTVLRSERFSKAFSAGLNSFIQRRGCWRALIIPTCCTCCAFGFRTTPPIWARCFIAAPP